MAPIVVYGLMFPGVGSSSSISLFSNLIASKLSTLTEFIVFFQDTLYCGGIPFAEQKKRNGRQWWKGEPFVRKEQSASTEAEETSVRISAQLFFLSKEQADVPVRMR
jgi:hypothetical protein